MLQVTFLTLACTALWPYIFSQRSKLLDRVCRFSRQRYRSTEDMILALAGQFKQLSHEPEKFISSVDFKHRTSYNTSFILHSFHGKTGAQQIDLLSTV